MDHRDVGNDPGLRPILLNDAHLLAHLDIGVVGGGQSAIEFRADKIVFVPKNGADAKHYTLHAGPASGVIDLHETTIDSEGREQHRTLFALRKDDLPTLLQELSPMGSELFSCGPCGWAG